MLPPYVNIDQINKKLANGISNLTPCEGCDDIYIVSESPEIKADEITYAIVSNNEVKSYAVYTATDSVNGKPCFNVGYETDPKYRNLGLAKRVLNESIRRLKADIAGLDKVADIIIKAVIKDDNIFSQKVIDNVMIKG